MGIINMLGQGFLSLSILIILHEGGHFIAARFFGMRVEKFYLFFDFWNLRIFKKKIGDTEYGIGLIPLGGYVKIAGMIDESMDNEQLAAEPKPDEFRSKPAWQRLIVLMGGIIVNLLLGILIFSLSLWYYGKSYTPLDAVNAKTGIYATEWGKELGFADGDKVLKVNGKSVESFADLLNPNEFMGDDLTYEINRNGVSKVLTMPDGFLKDIIKKQPFGMPTEFIVQKIQPGSNAAEAGLKKGDAFLTVNGNDARFYHQFKALLDQNKDKVISINVLRNSDTVNLNASVTSNGTLGFQLENTSFADAQKTKEYSLGSAFPAGNKMAFETLGVQVKSFGKMFSGKIKATESLGGPIAIFQNYGKTWNWQRFWYITGLLSLVLAFMNLLPIPVLDGGHAVFTIYEMLTGRPVNEKFLYVMQIIGMVLILALMVFVFGNDIYKLIK